MKKKGTFLETSCPLHHATRLHLVRPFSLDERRAGIQIMPGDDISVAFVHVEDDRESENEVNGI